MFGSVGWCLKGGKKRREERRRKEMERGEEKKVSEIGQFTRARHVRVSVDGWNGSDANAYSTPARRWVILRVARPRKVRVRVPLGTKLAHSKHNSRENVWRGGKVQSTRTRTWRIRVDGQKCLRRAYAPGARTRGLVLCFSKIVFYVFALNQAFQTSKQLRQHHRTLFNLLDSQINLTNQFKTWN